MLSFLQFYSDWAILYRQEGTLLKTVFSDTGAQYLRDSKNYL